MFRNFSLLFVIMIAFSFSSFGQTIDEIMETNLKAHGTRAKIDSVKSWKIVMQEKNVADNNSVVNTTIWFKKPDKFKTDITYQGKKIINETKPDEIYTTTYEGGHQLHDLTNFAVSLAYKISKPNAPLYEACEYNEFISFLEKRVQSKNFKENSTKEEYDKAVDKLKKARLKLKLGLIK